MPELSRREAEAQVRSWGFGHVFTWTDGANAYYAPHKHSGLTTHLILSGELTITYPQDALPTKETFGPGDRVDVDAGRSHEVWMGPNGCTSDNAEWLSYISPDRTIIALSSRNTVADVDFQRCDVSAAAPDRALDPSTTHVQSACAVHAVSPSVNEILDGTATVTRASSISIASTPRHAIDEPAIASFLSLLPFPPLLAPALATMVVAGNGTNATNPLDLFEGQTGAAQTKRGIAVHAFVLNIAVGLALFTFELSGFMLLKSSALGRRIYQPKTYLVQHRLRVEGIPVNPITWLRRIFAIKDEELKIKCGLDGYFFIRLLRGMIIIFVPLMIVLVTVLLPINYSGGSFTNTYEIGSHTSSPNITGLDTLSWQNVAPTDTDRFWAHLILAVLAISWTLWRIYREKVNFIDVRQRFLASPEQRIKASARTVLVTNIPAEYRSKEALEGLYDVFVDNDDHSKLTVWVNRDYSSLRALVAKRSSLRHALEKEELKILRKVNKKFHNKERHTNDEARPRSETSSATQGDAEQSITNAFEADCKDSSQLWHRYIEHSSQVTIIKGSDGKWAPASTLKFWASGEKKKVPKIAWLRYSIARLTVQIEDLLPHLDDDERFPRQNSAFIQFDRQMAANMACSLVSHHKYGRMSPRTVGVAPHEIVWPNMGVTSLWRLIRTFIALILFVGILILWGLPTTFLGILSQLDSWRDSTSWLAWLRPWPSWVISLISGPLVSILLALLIQLIVPALMRKLAVLIGAPTRSQREQITQQLYFTFLFIELVLVTSISSSIFATIPVLVKTPGNLPYILATNLPKSANYFFNYLIIQALGFSGSVLFQYLRILYITLIWPWFTQTPREEAFLQTTIPHQMWANVYGLMTNFAVIGLIFSVISPLILIFVSLMFSLFWIAYRHNYYFVQRNKVDTHGMLFNNAMSHLFAGVYVLEMALIGLFFLVRDTAGDVVCTPQAIIMIVVLCLTAVFHFVLEQNMRPLYEFVPVTLEDSAVDAEKERFLAPTSNRESIEKNPRVSFPADDKLELCDTVKPSDPDTPAGTDKFVDCPEPSDVDRPSATGEPADDDGKSTHETPARADNSSDTHKPVDTEKSADTDAAQSGEAEKQQSTTTDKPSDTGNPSDRPNSSYDLKPSRSTRKPQRHSTLLRRRNRDSAALKNNSATAANARQTFSRLTKETASKMRHLEPPHGRLASEGGGGGGASSAGSAAAHKRDVQDQLGAALESFPDELADLSPDERDAELRAAFQDPVTREPAPVIWLPHDPAGCADDTLRAVKGRYGDLLAYSDAGAFLNAKNKCEITQPAPDVRPDWLLDWVL